MPNIIYTVAERLEIVRHYGQGLGYQRIVDHFAAEHPDRPIPSKATVKRIIEKFKKTGNLNPALHKVTYPSRRITEETELNILLKSEENARGKIRKPMNQIAQELGCSKSTVHKILRKKKTKPSKKQTRREPLKRESVQRVTFSNNMIDHLKADPDLKDRICFADICSIELIGALNRQNDRLWSGNTSCLLIESKPQYQQKVNVWVGMVGDRLVGPFFINGNLSGEKYLRLLQEQIVPGIKAIQGDGQVIWFQQDDEPPHYSAAVRAYLTDVFGNHWIGRSAPVQWPARSTDLMALDFPLWSFLRNLIYSAGNIDNLQLLKKTIVEILERMDPIMIANMNQTFYNHLQRCSTTNQTHLENVPRPREG